ncbi:MULTISPECIES: bifunctional hydroxymethylpyrimidine kinase/phosphomethylpyrimidine kinase [Deefgea]|uniref:hydroxymethylpyrimidine kinase n=1 Tax=Deefgea chitinilytica TaxID=570276 RepID=A0ABS2CFM3_9NEIS|nr:MULTISPECIES: hydroxymethylpyrimidine/phosphomethylpyrimidine kinase [Deefgea]MBM5572949.1 hydroxymethylpyrimidine/phosphomethylpyrimidine kinase [Deefgea chitinilytica]MBM9890185.1 hydroxymethylpyrimidine/phosphomethylpyrimidine kinase [Deefgea sp. CFH1-16]
MNPTPPTVLVFAANDPSGGAGLMADVLTLASLGCHTLPIVTAMTVQDSAGVQEFHAIDAEIVDEQARFILEDIRIDAIKVGMVGSVENLAVIAEIASDYPDIPLILEPVFSMGRGEELSNEELIAAMRELLLPHTLLVTPNHTEARLLASDDPDEQEEIPLDAAAQRILECGCEYVLIAGTHEKTPKVVNTLYSRLGRVRTDQWERLPGSYHGAGATLASAIAGALANRIEIADAVRDAQDYTWQALSKAFRPGMGQFIPDRMFWARSSDEEIAAEIAEAAANAEFEPPKSVQ